MSFSNPIVISGSSAQLLSRIPLATGDAQFSEAWLQRQLFEQPHALPLKEIAPHLGEVAPVCMELNTLAGPADILYVTTTGQVVLVETKLWRNPEARRTVVAQILDYAKELTAWTYEDLDREVAKATGRGPGYLLVSARQRFATLDEREFTDGINHSLRRGEIVLLIVGDGIRSGTEALVAFLERYGSLRFSFGLVEVAAYQLGDGVLLCPRVLAKTELIRRVVAVAVAADGTELAALPAPQDAGNDEAPGSSEQREYGQWLGAFWTDYLERLVLDDATQLKPRKPPRGTNAFFPMPPSGRECWVSAYIARGTDQIGVYLAFANKYELAADAYEQLYCDREDIEKEIGVQLDWVSRNEGTPTIWVVRPLGDWRNPQVRSQHLAWLTGVTNRFVNAFRPRLNAYFRKVEQKLP
ncbi:DUF4268 domain-containing protein [Aquincola tertiaricarbonis]|uniref:DUF4268 domain-containing protein n=1 Tax=Aquincola tertiaricarbonis TaxID=391953 RepID=UPI000698D8E3|nr:DUF4268 domain-containing protein [Aquincola tertiaricarbonis]